MSYPCFTSVTPTICRLLGLEPPQDSTKELLAEVVSAQQEKFSGAVEKALLFLPDAVGIAQHSLVPDLRDRVQVQAPISCKLSAVMPSVTPVCFASMLSGAQPAVHGITKYCKPVLTCETLFDSLVKSGKRVVIIAQQNCSMDRIFRDRAIEYITTVDDRQTVEYTLDLIARDRHDVIVCYQEDYDSEQHRSDWNSPEAVAVLNSVLSRFEEVSEAFHAGYAKYDRLLAFCPDHGGYHCDKSGHGTHGTDMPADMEVEHFFGLFGKGCQG